MKTGTISIRYAKAIYLYAKSMSEEEVLYRQMKTLCRTLIRMKKLSKMICDPAIDKETKYKTLSVMAGGSTGESFRKSVMLVLKNRREKYLLLIAESYIDIFRRENGIIAGRLATAEEMTEEEKERLSSVFKGNGIKKIELESSVDKNLIGGFIFQTDNYRLDASVSGQLEKIEKKLLS